MKIKNVWTKNLKELNQQVESLRTSSFGLQFLTSGGTIYAVAADGSNYVKVLNGFLAHTSVDLKSVQVK